MKEIERLRKQHIRNANATNAQPNIRQIFVRQAKTITYAEILARDVLPSVSIQNDDGTFIALFGFSRFGDGDTM